MMHGDLFAPRRPPAPHAGKWPTEQLSDLLTGKVAWDDASDSIRSWAAFYIHDAAKQVLSIAGIEGRRSALDKLPAFIRPIVEDEARRLWEWDKRKGA